MKLRFGPSHALLIAETDEVCLLREREVPGTRFMGAGDNDGFRIRGAERRENVYEVRRRLVVGRGLGMYSSSSKTLSLSSSASSSESWTGLLDAMHLRLRLEGNGGGDFGAGGIIRAVAFDRGSFGGIGDCEGAIRGLCR